MIVQLNTTFSTFHEWSRRIGMRPAEWFDATLLQIRRSPSAQANSTFPCSITLLQLFHISRPIGTFLCFLLQINILAFCTSGCCSTFLMLAYRMFLEANRRFVLKATSHLRTVDIHFKDCHQHLAYDFSNCGTRPNTGRPTPLSWFTALIKQNA